MTSTERINPDSVIQVSSRVKGLINNQLKQILRKEGLPVSGPKAALQTRIIDRESNFSIRCNPHKTDFTSWNLCRSLSDQATWHLPD